MPRPLRLLRFAEVTPWTTTTAGPFDPAEDEPSDAYLEGFTLWGLGYLDARSWRHYLPRLIDYALRRPTDPAMVRHSP